MQPSKYATYSEKSARFDCSFGNVFFTILMQAIIGHETRES